MDHGDMRNKAKRKPRSFGVPRVPCQRCRSQRLVEQMQCPRSRLLASASGHAVVEMMDAFKLLPGRALLLSGSPPFRRGRRERPTCPTAKPQLRLWTITASCVALKFLAFEPGGVPRPSMCC